MLWPGASLAYCHRNYSAIFSVLRAMLYALVRPLLSVSDKTSLLFLSYALPCALVRPLLNERSDCHLGPNKSSSSSPLPQRYEKSTPLIVSFSHIIIPVLLYAFCLWYNLKKIKDVLASDRAFMWYRQPYRKTLLEFIADRSQACWKYNV